jgi:hypothetical protein
MKQGGSGKQGCRSLVSETAAGNRKLEFLTTVRRRPATEYAYPTAFAAMLRRNLIWRDLPLRKNYAPWQRSREERYEARQRSFLHGASLALVPAIALLPAWVFLVHTPRFNNSETLAVVLFPALAISFATGVRKLVHCLLNRDFDAITAFAFGVLLILFVVLVYDGVFLYALRWGHVA